MITAMLIRKMGKNTQIGQSTRRGSAKGLITITVRYALVSLVTFVPSGSFPSVTMQSTPLRTGSREYSSICYVMRESIVLISTHNTILIAGRLDLGPGLYSACLQPDILLVLSQSPSGWLGHQTDLPHECQGV